MKKYLFFAYSVFFCSVFNTKADGIELSRFHRLALSFRDSSFVYDNSYNALTFGIGRTSDPGWPEADSSGIDSAAVFSRGIDAAFSGYVEQLTSVRKVYRGIFHKASIAFTRNTTGLNSDISSIDPFFESFYLDTVKSAVGLTGEHNWQLSRQFETSTRLKPFFKPSITAKWFLDYYSEQSRMPGIPSGYIPGTYYQKAMRCSLITLPNIQIGFGRTADIAPVYRAFMLERELKRTGAAKFDMSDKSIAGISGLAASCGSHFRGFDRIRKFKTDLDSIIIRDESADTVRLKYLSQFQLKRLMARRIPDFKAGPQLGVSAAGNCEYLFKAFNISQVQDFDEGYIDSIGSFMDVNADVTASAFVRWGIPAGPRLFLDIESVKKIVSSAHGFELTDKDGFLDNEIIRTDWNLTASFWAAIRLLVRIGCQSVPAAVIIPKNLPYRTWCEFDFMIEDNLSVLVSVSIYNADPNEFSFIKNSFGRERGGFSVSLLTSYMF